MRAVVVGKGPERNSERVRYLGVLEALVFICTLAMTLCLLLGSRKTLARVHCQLADQVLCLVMAAFNTSGCP